MKVLLVHNHYQQPGGEDVVFAAEGRLLESRGHQVVRYTAHNDQAAALGPLTLARTAVWSADAYGELRGLLAREQPDVVHVHNTLPLVSPAVYYAARRAGVPVVQTLHNYRLLCPNAIFFRDGRVCEDCLGKSLPYPGVVHACYRGSRAASGAVAAMLTIHRALGTWTRQVDLFVALTEFARRKFVEGGVPTDQLFVKPNFVDPDPGEGPGDGGYALYVGRLAPEKGVRTLLAAWRRAAPGLPLRIVGDGPLAPEVAAAASSPSIEWLGHQPPERVAALVGRAAVVLCPSEIYETFGLVVVEAFAAGTPVIGTDTGAVAELIEHGVTGMHFRAGDVTALAERVAWASAHPAALLAMRAHARRRYVDRYTADRNYPMLMEAYARARERAGGPARARAAHAVTAGLAADAPNHGTTAGGWR